MENYHLSQVEHHFQGLTHSCHKKDVYPKNSIVGSKKFITFSLPDLPKHLIEIQR